MRIDLAGFARGGRDHSHSEMLTLCETAERLGFEGIWFNEFHFQEPPQAYPSITILASSILARTSRLRVGASAIITPLHHPLLLAEDIAQLHWQSGGRFDLGIGRGTHQDTFCALGVDIDTARDRFEQAFDIVTDAWATGIETTSGRSVGPLLPDEKVPVYVAGTSKETLGFAARNKLPLLLSLDPPEAAQLATCRNILAETGHACDLRESSLSRYVCIDTSRDRAMEKLDRLLPQFHQRRLRAAHEAGRDVSTVVMPDRETALQRQFIAGSPEECAAQLVGLQRETGIRAVRLVFNGNGVIDWQTAERDMRLFSAHVMPALKQRDIAPP